MRYASRSTDGPRSSTSHSPLRGGVDSSRSRGHTKPLARGADLGADTRPPGDPCAARRCTRGCAAAAAIRPSRTRGRSPRSPRRSAPRAPPRGNSPSARHPRRRRHWRHHWRRHRRWYRWSTRRHVRPPPALSRSPREWALAAASAHAS
eukprot:3766794-Prymnesium_polylepis.1